jgi:hypothetical protein
VSRILAKRAAITGEPKRNSRKINQASVRIFGNRQSGLIGGVIAWFATNYYGRNLLRFWDQRLEAYKALCLLQSTPDGSPSLRHLAAEIEGLEVILPTPLRWYLCIRRYDLRSAAKGLIALADRLGGGDVSESYDIACLRVLVRDSLRLPSQEGDQHVAESRRRLETSGMWPPLVT